MLPVIEQLVPTATVAPVAVTSMTSPDFPLFGFRIKVPERSAPCALGVATDDIETNSADDSSSTRYRELLE
jgi:hypothetical protein